MTDVDVAAATVNTVPSVGSHGFSRRMACTGAVSGVVFVSLSTMVQLWFAPLVAGIVLGGVARWRQARAGVAVVLAAAAALGGWGVPLLWQAIAGLPVVETADVVAALAGLPGGGWLVVAVTLLVALGQGLIGVWTGLALVGLRSDVDAGETQSAEDRTASR